MKKSILINKKSPLEILRSRLLNHISSTALPSAIVSKIENEEIFMMEVSTINRYYKIPISHILSFISVQEGKELNEFISLNSGKVIVGYLEGGLPLYTFAYSPKEIRKINTKNTVRTKGLGKHFRTNLLSWEPT